MKSVLSIQFLLLFALSSCNKTDKEELIIKNRFCTSLILRNAQIVATILSETEKMSSPRVLKTHSNVDRIRLWRESYLASRSRKDLLSFCDSVSAYYQKIEHKDKVITAGIANGKKEILSSDSLAVLNLLYWTLSAELGILDNEAKNLSAGLRFDNSVPSFVNGKAFLLKDTVLIAANLGYILSEQEYIYDFSKVTWKNKDTDEVSIPKLTKIGPVYLFTYVPDKRGRYVVEGEVSIKNYPGMDVVMNMHNEFVVK